MKGFEFVVMNGEAYRFYDVINGLSFIEGVEPCDVEAYFFGD